jgi:hypothetical protein
MSTPAIQVINLWTPPTAQLSNAAPFAITTPTASSNLAVAVTILSGPATIAYSNNVYTITLTGAPGVVSLALNQAGDGTNYLPATQQVYSFSVLESLSLPRVVHAQDFNSDEFKGSDWVFSSSVGTPQIPAIIEALDLGTFTSLADPGLVVTSVPVFAWDPTTPPSIPDPGPPRILPPTLPNQPAPNLGNSLVVQAWGDPHFVVTGDVGSYSQNIPVLAYPTAGNTQTTTIEYTANATSVQSAGTQVWLYNSTNSVLNGSFSVVQGYAGPVIAGSNGLQTMYLTIPVNLNLAAGSNQSFVASMSLVQAIMSRTVRFLVGENAYSDRTLFLWIKNKDNSEWRVSYQKQPYGNGAFTIQSVRIESLINGVKTIIDPTSSNITYNVGGFMNLSNVDGGGYIILNTNSYNGSNVSQWAGLFYGFCQSSYNSGALTTNCGDGPGHNGRAIVAQSIGLPEDSWADIVNNSTTNITTLLQSLDSPQTFDINVFNALCYFGEDASNKVYPMGTLSTYTPTYFYTANATVGSVYADQLVVNPYPNNIVYVSFSGTVDDDLMINGIDVENIGQQHHPTYSFILPVHTPSFRVAVINKQNTQAKLDVGITFTVIG